jgi:putative ABC transport system permease protein
MLLYPDSGQRLSVYRPYRQTPLVGAFLIRTTGNPMRIANSVRDQVRAIDSDQAITAMKPLENLLEDAMGQRRLVLTLLDLFAAVAVLLAVVGVYGVISHTVSQRTREVGVRIALGARARDIVFALVGQAFLITMAGIAIGVGGAFGLTRFLKSYLFQVSPTEATTFIAVALLFVLVASASTYLPLRRATRIDPMAVLRHE